jgi:hypothetical protein
MSLKLTNRNIILFLNCHEKIPFEDSGIQMSYKVFSLPPVNFLLFQTVSETKPICMWSSGYKFEYFRLNWLKKIENLFYFLIFFNCKFIQDILNVRRYFRFEQNIFVCFWMNKTKFQSMKNWSVNIYRLR